MLTDTAARNAKPKEKSYKLSDSGGMHLFITPKGSKSWRLKYRYQGKEGQQVLGSYPQMSLKEARVRRDWLKEQLKAGKNPAVLKKLRSGGASSEQSFEAIARQWHEKNKRKWRDRHSDDVLTSLERDIFPFMGSMHVDAIDESYLLEILRRVEDRGAIETAHRIRQRCERVFKTAKVLGHTRNNPAADLGELLEPIIKGRRWPALVDIDDLRHLIATVDVASASPVTRLASRFLALTGQRPGMVNGAEWSEFDHNFRSQERPITVTWTIPAAKMKQDIHRREMNEFDHAVPLSKAAVDVLGAVASLTGDSRYVFPSGRSMNEPMSENALSSLYKREGFKGKHVPHGWRSSFSTVMNSRVERAFPGSDRLFVERLIIDLMLAHVPAGVSATELIYNRSRYAERRREIAEDWASILMEGQLNASELLNSPRRRAI